MGFLWGLKLEKAREEKNGNKLKGYQEMFDTSGKKKQKHFLKHWPDSFFRMDKEETQYVFPSLSRTS